MIPAKIGAFQSEVCLYMKRCIFQTERSNLLQFFSTCEVHLFESCKAFQDLQFFESNPLFVHEVHFFESCNVSRTCNPLGSVTFF